MKFKLFSALFVLALIATPAVAQTAAHDHAPAPAAVTGSQQAFDKLKSLAGSWVARLSTTPQFAPVEGKFAQFSLQVASRGNALVHEMSISGLPDHPVTMFYLQDDRLMLTHYCDAGNRPRMVGTLSADGARLEFEFVDISGSTKPGHMHRAVFTFLDDDTHTEEWTFVSAEGTPVVARFDLQRTNFAASR